MEQRKGDGGGRRVEWGRTRDEAGGLQDEARAPSPTTDEELQRVGRGRQTQKDDRHFAVVHLETFSNKNLVREETKCLDR